MTTMHMENQQQLPTILSKAINLKRQTNLNTTKTNLPTHSLVLLKMGKITARNMLS